MKKIGLTLFLMSIVALTSCQTVIMSVNKTPSSSKSYETSWGNGKCYIYYDVKGYGKAFNFKRVLESNENIFNSENKSVLDQEIIGLFSSTRNQEVVISEEKSELDRFRIKNIRVHKTNGVMGCFGMGASCLSIVTLNLIPAYLQYNVRTILIDMKTGEKHIARDNVTIVWGAGIYLTSALGITQKIPNEEGWSWLGVVLYNQLSTLLASMK